MKKIKMLLVVMLLLSVGLLSGCIAESEEKGWSKYKEGLLVNSKYNNGLFDLPTSVVLYFSDGSSVRIDGDSEYINKDSLYQVSKYYKGNNVSIVYTKDTNFKGNGVTRIICDSFELIVEGR